MDQHSQAQALDSVTDHVEERATEVDGSAVAQAMKELAEAEREARETEVRRKKELDAVQVAPADVESLMEEFDLGKDAADLALRENGGDLKATLLHLVKC